MAVGGLTLDDVVEVLTGSVVLFEPGVMLAMTRRRRSAIRSDTDAWLTEGAMLARDLVIATDDFDAWDLDDDAEVGLTTVGSLIDMLDIRAAMSSTVWTWAGRLAAAGTAEPLTWTD